MPSYQQRTYKNSPPPVTWNTTKRAPLSVAQLKQVFAWADLPYNSGRASDVTTLNSRLVQAGWPPIPGATYSANDYERYLGHITPDTSGDIFSDDWTPPRSPPPVKWSSSRTTPLSDAEYTRLWRYLGFSEAPTTDTEVQVLDDRIEAVGLPPLPEEDAAPPPRAVTPIRRMSTSTRQRAPARATTIAQKAPRSSRAQPPREVMDEQTANDLADKLYAQGWQRLSEIDSATRSQPDFNSSYTFRSFWTRVVQYSPSVLVKPETWVKPNDGSGDATSKRTDLHDTLQDNGWTPAADLPSDMTANAVASDHWQVQDFPTVTNDDDGNSIAQNEQWVRPVSPAAILDYNAFALNDAADITDQAAQEDSPFSEQQPARVTSQRAPAKTKAAAKKKATPKKATPPASIASSAQKIAASAARALMPSISIKPTAAKGTAAYAAQSAIARTVTQQATQLASKATNLLTNALTSKITGAVKDAVLTQAPAPVSTGVASSGAIEAAADAADIAPAGFHFQTVTSAGGGTATIAVPDAIAASADAVPVSQIGAELATIGDAGATAAGIGEAASAAIGGADLTAAGAAADAAAAAGAEFSLAGVVPYAAAAIAIYTIAKKLGLFGNSAGYAHTTGIEYHGTFGPSGYQGQVFGHSSNGQDNYRFDQPLLPYQNALNPVTQPLYDTLGLAPAEIPIDVMGSGDEQLGRYALVPVILQYAHDHNIPIPPETLNDINANIARIQADIDARNQPPDGDSHGQNGGD